MSKNIKKFFSQNISFLLVLLFLLLFSCLLPTFFSLKNFVNILRQSSYLIVAALGISLILISGQMDLSVGYTISLTGVSAMLLMTKFSWPVAYTVFFALAFGVFLSLFNMLLSYLFKLKLILVTIGTMTIFQGVAYSITTPLRVISGFSGEFKMFGQGSLGAVPISVIITVVLYLLVRLILTKTYMGRYVFALGRNETAIKLAGISIFALRLFISVMAGLMIGISSILLCSRLGAIKANSAENAEITIITAYLLGGGSVRGGSGRLLGILAGVLALSIMTNGLHLAGADVYFQLVVKGVILLTSLIFDAYHQPCSNTNNVLS